MKKGLTGHETRTVFTAGKKKRIHLKSCPCWKKEKENDATLQSYAS